MNWYWWNFTELQFTTWWCAYRTNINGDKLKRDNYLCCTGWGIFYDLTHSSNFNCNKYKCQCYIFFLQVPAKSESVLFFGPVVPDGYGFCYNPQEKCILFGVSSFKSNKSTVSAAQMAEYIEQSLCDMQDVMSSAPMASLWTSRINWWYSLLMITGNHTIPADNWKPYQTSRQLETIPDQQTTSTTWQITL